MQNWLVVTILRVVMTVADAARRLRKQMDAPLWAASVAAAREKGEMVILVRVDPRYGRPLNLPPSFEGFKVVSVVRAAIRAYR
jgi:hypothetical protein